MSDFSLFLVLRKENKQNSDMTWQRYKLNLRNSLLLEDYFRVMEQFDSTLSSVIDSTLGLRCRSLGYQYSEIIRSLMSIYFCGGSCIEDVTTHLMNHLSLHPTLHTCSSDTILRAIKELTQENISYTSDTGKNYDFNTADTLNTLLLNCMFASDQLKEGEKYDAKPTYKKFSGYRPGVAVIGDLIVGIENSDGNTKVPFHGTFSRHGRA